MLPTGEVAQVRRGDPVPADWPAVRWPEPHLKTAAGYSPAGTWLDLLVGSEGTLGVVTRATVRLTDLPPDVIGLVAFFADRAGAVRFAAVGDAARRDPSGPLSPRCLEYYDRACLEVARDRLGWVPDGAGAALFCEQEVAGDPDASLGAWLSGAERAGPWPTTPCSPPPRPGAPACSPCGTPSRPGSTSGSWPTACARWAPIWPSPTPRSTG
ncbi:MAG: hypothetical protein R3F59_28145 [Myxococcota bacterium]